MFSNQDVADYYDQTQHHYENWWQLRDHLSLHYGIWEQETKTFAEALENTNRILAETAGISDQTRVLDAGCGVGGAAMFLAKQYKAQVRGISLSPKQIKLANETAFSRNLSDRVQFELKDFTATEYESESFDVVWACESVCHAQDKQAFTDEAFRLLKPGGKLVLFDFFLTAEDQEDSKAYINKWAATWGVPAFRSVTGFQDDLKVSGFRKINQQDYTSKIQKSAKRLYNAAIWGAIPAEFYNLFHPKVQRWTKTHYQCGYWQYKALKKDLWKYSLFSAEKPA